MSEIRITKDLRKATVFVLISIICLSTHTELLAAGDSEKSVLVNRYVFQSEQSTIVQTGGIAGVHWTYIVEGQFILNVDFDAHTAKFEQVDANAMDDSQYKRTLDPNEVFNMTSLEGVVQDNTTIVFSGKQESGSAIQLTVTLQDDSLHLAGNTTPPPNSADFFIFSIDALAKQKYSSGTGEPNEPYQIAKSNDWVEFMNTSSDWNKNFLMTDDIDMNGVSLKPVGNDTTHFTGILDGNKHKISNADVNLPDGNYIGLFGYVDLDGKIYNLGLDNVKITGNKYTGGLIGKSNGTVTKCYSIGTVIGNNYVGGLIGYKGYGSIYQCYSNGLVSGNRSVGGLTGLNYGYDFSYIVQSYSRCTILGNENVGGIIGETFGGSIKECYSSGFVSGNLYTGGLIGALFSTTATPDFPISNSFWDVQTSGTSDGIGNVNPDPNGIKGKTTIEMKTKSTFTDTGWDFVDETHNGTDDIWWIDNGNDYPRLSWEREPVRLPVIELDPADFDAAIAKGVILVDFYAIWCSHCTTQAPILEEVADQLEGRAQVAKLNVDNAADIIQQYGIYGIPTLIVFQEGIEVKRFVGETSAKDLVAAVLAALRSM